jgi:methyl-accepting chemotaxis protein
MHGQCSKEKEIPMRRLSGRTITLVAAGSLLVACGVAVAEPQSEAGLTEQDQQMLAWCKEAAARMVVVMERWVRAGAVTEEQLFSAKYSPIPDTDPQKFHTDYDTLSDHEIGPIQEVYFAKAPEIAYVVLVDRNGYLPTHLRKYSQPLTGDKQADLIGNRTKRKFDDPIGLKAARDTKPYLLQSYVIDTGKSYKAFSVPIVLFGKHWGALRLGYRLN